VWIMCATYVEQYRHRDTFLYDAMFCAHVLRVCVRAPRASVLVRPHTIRLRADGMEMDNHSWHIHRLQHTSSLGLNTSNAIEKRGLY
jgi:hypothetical protein